MSPKSLHMAPKRLPLDPPCSNLAPPDLLTRQTAAERCSSTKNEFSPPISPKNGPESPPRTEIPPNWPQLWCPGGGGHEVTFRTFRRLGPSLGPSGSSRSTEGPFGTPKRPPNLIQSLKSVPNVVKQIHTLTKECIKAQRTARRD